MNLNSHLPNNWCFFTTVLKLIEINKWNKLRIKYRTFHLHLVVTEIKFIYKSEATKIIVNKIIDFIFFGLKSIKV